MYVCVWGGCGRNRWQKEVHRLALKNPRVARVTVMDEKQRQGTGKMEFDRQLCCACNHILHTAWFEQEDADGECAPISLGREY